MAKSQATFNKKENEKKRLKKRQDKQEKREERQANKKEMTLEDMMAYVDEYGNITSTPPDPTKKRKINSEDILISTPRQEDIIDENPVKKGVVTLFKADKGYGFIRNTETQESVFVHINGVITQIKEGDKVSFEVEKGQKGPTAVKVQVIK
jgi:cold shock CspA family protein